MTRMDERAAHHTPGQDAVLDGRQLMSQDAPYGRFSPTVRREAPAAVNERVADDVKRRRPAGWA